MDDGECQSRSNRPGPSRRVVLFISLILQIRLSSSLDNELQTMRLEGIEKHDINIYIEQRVEYVHSQILLNPIITGIEQATKLSAEFENRANTTFGRILSGRVKRMVKRSEIKLTKLCGRKGRRVRETKLLREKRSIEFVGNLISKLFGNPGPEDWKQNTKNILAMKAAIERQVANSLIEHSDIDQNRHAINEQSEILRHTARSVIRNENRLKIVDNELTELETFMELGEMFESIEVILESLVDIKRDSKTGRCNEKGLNPEFLIENLRALESNKDSIAPVFASWEWQMYYRHEMCTLAIHENELWVTLRIPIVNLGEQFVTVTPLVNQMWIRDTFYDTGFEISLFKHKYQELFMVAMKSNIELCSKLGSIRVCSMRNTKFRESNPFAVPLDINHNRVLVITNNTRATFEGKSICSNSIETITFIGHTTSKIPDRCTLVSKSFEVSKFSQISYINTTNNLDKIETVKLKQPLSRSENIDQPLREMTRLQSTDTNSTFELNNKSTLKELAQVNTETKWSTESLFFTASGSCASLMIIVIVAFLFIKCIKNSAKKSASSVVINLDSVNKKEKDERVNLEYIELDTDNRQKNSENADSNDSSNEFKLERNANKEKKPLDSTSRPMCHFNKN